MFKNVIARIKALITADNRDFNKKMKDAGKEMDKTGKKSQGVGKMVKAAMGTMAVAAAIKLVKNMAQVRMEFEKYEAMLKVALGSQDAATESMKQLQQFAAETPFQLNQLTGSYVKLVNQGFKPGMKEMKSMGDLAAAMGKDFDMLTEAIIDAQTGEFERLKEFGIRASKAGDQVTFSFKEQQTQTEFTASAIRDYILSLGETEGISGSMAEISATLGGRVSNLGDAWDRLMNTMGAKSSGVMISVINGLIKMAEGMERIVKGAKALKAEVWDAMAKDTAGARQEIETMAASMVKGGMEQAQATQRAKELYLQSMAQRIKAQEEEVASFTGKLKRKDKKALEFEQKQLQMLKDEVEAVKNYYVETEALATKAAEKEAEAQQKIAAQEKIIQDKRLEATRKFWEEKLKIQGTSTALLLQGSTAEEYKMIALERTQRNYQATLQAGNEKLSEASTAHQKLADTIDYGVAPGIIGASEQTEAWTTTLNRNVQQSGLMNSTLDSMVSAFDYTSEQIKADYEAITLAAGYSQKEVDQAEENMRNMWKHSAKAALNSARTIVKAEIAKGVASTVADALATIPFPFNIAAAGVAAGAASLLFDQLVPSFAEGGMVTGPTLAMVGDNPGGKEAIIPWNKLQDMVGGSSPAEVKIKGSDLYLVMERYNRTVTRAGG